MLWHIYLTRYCNLHCTYCGADPSFETIPLEPQYSIESLTNFLKQDTEPVVNFYGGEPLLRIKLMLELIDTLIIEIPNIKFVLQTNGLLLNKIPSLYVNLFHSILVSLDGKPSITNKYRGKGVFEKVKANIDYITKDCGFSGELIARMTVSKHSDIFKDVIFLINPENGLNFTHVHWQLDALWNSDNWPDFSIWMQEIYNPGIKKLIFWWLTEIKEKNTIHKIVPFLGILTTLLTNKQTDIRCGAGQTSYTISTDGTLIFCPICPEEPEAITGSLGSAISEIKKISLSEPCDSCDVRSICGGRCLYTNYFKIGSSADYNDVCQSIKVLISTLAENLPALQEMLKDEKIDIKDILYPEINNGTEIIP